MENNRKINFTQKLANFTMAEHYKFSASILLMLLQSSYLLLLAVVSFYIILC